MDNCMAWRLDIPLGTGDLECIRRSTAFALGGV
jgi:hypothetical protein